MKFIVNALRIIAACFLFGAGMVLVIPGALMSKAASKLAARVREDMEAD